MNLITRLKNIWSLSEYQAGAPQDEYKIPGTQIITLTKKPESHRSATFIPRTPTKPIDRINNTNITNQ